MYTGVNCISEHTFTKHMNCVRSRKSSKPNRLQLSTKTEKDECSELSNDMGVGGGIKVQVNSEAETRM